MGTGRIVEIPQVGGLHHHYEDLVSVQSITLLAILDTFAVKFECRKTSCRSINGWSFQ